MSGFWHLRDAAENEIRSPDGFFAASVSTPQVRADGHGTRIAHGTKHRGVKMVRESEADLLPILSAPGYRRGMENVVENRAEILARIEAARKAAVAPATDTTLIAVSKMHGEAPIRALLESGQRHFGENRVQEAYAKWPALKEEFPDIVLHLIGPLQTNKAREAVALFDVFHTLDRPKLIDALAKEFDHAGKTPDLFVQVNTGAEPQKAGALPEDAPAFIEQAKQTFAGQVKGLMCIPPAEEAPAPHFAFLQKLAQDAGVADLSMGMSHDFETAIRFGASFVRVGSAIFGARDYSTAH